MDKQKVTITCEHCQTKGEVEVVKGACLASYECKSCGKTTSAKEGKCCVMCSSEDAELPVHAKAAA